MIVSDRLQQLALCILQVDFGSEKSVFEFQSIFELFELLKRRLSNLYLQLVACRELVFDVL